MRVGRGESASLRITLPRPSPLIAGIVVALCAYVHNLTTSLQNHIGAYGGGHYTACVRSSRGEWLLMDDSHSIPMSNGFRAAVTPNAYLLVYVQTG